VWEEQRDGSSSRGRERLEKKLGSPDGSPHPTLVVRVVVRGARRARGHVTDDKGEKEATRVENEVEEASRVGGVV
jgi:hypothetical protein